MTNIFGPGHTVDANETTSRPTQIAPLQAIDTWFKDCTAGLQDGTKVQDQWLNFIVATLRQAVRTGGATQGDLIETMLAEAMGRYASGAIYCVDGGTANACVLSSPSGFTMPKSYFDGMRVQFRPVADNTGATQINAFGLGNKYLANPDGTFAALAKTLRAGELTELFYDTAGNGGVGAWRPAPWAVDLDLQGYRIIPAGTVMLFWQASAPVGWTKLTTQNDKTIRVVSGTGGVVGGSVDFSTVFARTAVDTHTLTQAELPAVNLSAVNLATGIVILDTNFTPSAQGGASGGIQFLNNLSVFSKTSGTSPISGFVPLGGSGVAHAHNIDLRVKYIDVILCQRN